MAGSLSELKRMENSDYCWIIDSLHQPSKFNFKINTHAANREIRFDTNESSKN